MDNAEFYLFLSDAANLAFQDFQTWETAAQLTELRFNKSLTTCPSIMNCWMLEGF